MKAARVFLLWACWYVNTQDDKHDNYTWASASFAFVSVSMAFPNLCAIVCFSECVCVCTGPHPGFCDVSDIMGEWWEWVSACVCQISVCFYVFFATRENKYFYEALEASVHQGYKQYTYAQLCLWTKHQWSDTVCGCHGNDSCDSSREDLQEVLWAVWSCVTTRASPNPLSVYCLLPQTYLLGIIISICGNVLISISLNIQVGDTGIQLYNRHRAQWALNACKDSVFPL